MSTDQETIFFAAISGSESSKNLAIGCEKIYEKISSGDQLLDIFRFGVDNIDVSVEDEDINIDILVNDLFNQKKEKFLSDKGIVEVSLAEMSKIAKAITARQEESIISKLSTTENLVREKIKNFIEEYDLEEPAQKQFLSGLRKDILSNKEIDFNYLQGKRGSDCFNAEIIELMVALSDELYEKIKAEENKNKSKKEKISIK